MLANIVIVGSFTIASLAILELLLSDSQKQQLERLLLKTWSRLDDVKGRSLTVWLRKAKNKRRLLVTIVIALFAFILGLKWIEPRIPWFNIASLVLAAALVSVPSAFFIMTMLASKGTLFRIYFTAGAIAAALAIPALGGTLELRLGSMPELKLVVRAVTYVLWTTDLLYVLASAPFIFAVVVSLALNIVEFLIRRIAEYPKGPIIGVSILVGGIVAVIKAVN